MTDDGAAAAFAQDVVFLRYAGLRPVVVHGGGPQISAQLDRLGIESTFRAGLRVTTPEAMDVVRMVLTGQVNREVVGLINQHGPFAVGHVGRGRAPAHRAPAARHRGRRAGRPRPGRRGRDGQPRRGRARCWPTAASRSSPASPAATAARCSTSTPTRPPRRWRSRCGAAKLDRADRRGGPVRELAGDGRRRPPRPGRRPEVISQLTASRAGGDAARPERRHDPQDGGLPDRGARRRAAGPRARRPAAARRPAGDLHRLGDRHHGRPRPRPDHPDPASR